MVPSDTGLGLGCCKVGSIAFDMEHHVTGNEVEYGMGMCGAVVEEVGECS